MHELTIAYSSNTIFGFTEPGSGKNKTECQDSYSIIDIPEDHLKYFAVYDGHGHVGKSVSAQRILAINFISDIVRFSFKEYILYEIQIGVTSRKGIRRRADQEEFEEVA